MKLYSLSNETNQMQEIKALSNGLPIGCKIYSYGYAMSESVGVITSEPNEYGAQEGVYIAGNKGFFTIDKYTQPHSKKFGIGHYYDDSFECVTADVIAVHTASAVKHNENVAREAEVKRLADEAEVKALPKKYPHLTVNSNGDQATTKKNIVATLKKFWPLVKFSVRKEHYNTYNVSWVDGPTTMEVDKELKRFESYSNDETGDFRDYNPSNFNNVFGGMKYLFTRREMSPEVEALKPAFIELFGEQSHYGEADNTFYRVFRKSSIQAGVIPVAIVEVENACGMIEDLYTYSFNADDVAEAAPVEKIEVPAGEVSIIDYSEKAIAVVGDTKPIKEQLKELGGKFNFRLSCGAGWIFPKTKLADIQTLLTA